MDEQDPFDALRQMAEQHHKLAEKSHMTKAARRKQVLSILYDERDRNVEVASNALDHVMADISQYIYAMTEEDHPSSTQAYRYLRLCFDEIRKCLDPQLMNFETGDVPKKIYMQLTPWREEDE